MFSTDFDLATAVERDLHAGLPHVLTAAGLGPEARAMITAYAEKSRNLAPIARMLEDYLGAGAHRIQGWTSAVRELDAIHRDYSREVRDGGTETAEWEADVGAELLARLRQTAQTAAAIVAEA